MHSLARNHALVDGAEALVVSVASGELDVPALAAPIGSPVRDRLSRRRTPSSPLFLRLLSGIRYGRRMPTRYSHCVARLVAKLGDELMAEVDALVAEGAAASRSDAVRLGLERLVDEHRRRRGGNVDR